jgi:hypothetical protein
VSSSQHVKARGSSGIAIALAVWLFTEASVKSRFGVGTKAPPNRIDKHWTLQLLLLDFLYLTLATLSANRSSDSDIYAQSFCHQRHMTRMTVPIPDVTVGVLALQGAFSEHLQLLRQATETLKLRTVKWAFLEVRTPSELARCDGLILPGGESTTMSLVAARSGMLEPLRDFVK